MSRKSWHMRTVDGLTVHARQWPPRFDVEAVADMPSAHPKRLAQQVRQDLWRSLQDLRGFSPVVTVEPIGAGVRVRAGGRLVGPVPSGTADAIQSLLDDPTRQSRWLRWARVRA